MLGGGAFLPFLILLLGLRSRGGISRAPKSAPKVARTTQRMAHYGLGAVRLSESAADLRARRRSKRRWRAQTRCLVRSQLREQHVGRQHLSQLPCRPHGWQRYVPGVEVSRVTRAPGEQCVRRLGRFAGL